MPKAVMVNATQHAADPVTPNSVTVIIEFHIVGIDPDLGILYASTSLTDTDTAATAVLKIQNAIIAKAADYGVTLTVSDLISLVLGVPQALMSSTSSATVTLIDDGVNLDVYGSLGALRFSAASAAGPRLELVPDSGAMQIQFRPSGSILAFNLFDTFGTGDLTAFGLPASATGYTVLEDRGLVGLILSTEGALPVSVRPNRTEVAKFDGNGLNMAAGAQLKNVAAPAGGKSVTNNVTAGGTADQGDDFTNLTLYATDAAAIRNNIYQLWQKCDRMADGLRTLGLLANS